MNLHSIRTLAVAAVIAFSGNTQAQTVIKTGSYAAGEQAYGGGSVFLSPGTYRFDFATTGPLAQFYGQVELQSYWAAYCDEREGAGEFFCGGDNVPTIPLFDSITPTRYQLKITVRPFTETHTPDAFVVRTIEYDDCCTYAFDFTSREAGAYSISYAAIPEPSTWALFILGFGVVGAEARNWRRRAGNRSVKTFHIPWRMPEISR